MIIKCLVGVGTCCSPPTLVVASLLLTNLVMQVSIMLCIIVDTQPTSACSVGPATQFIFRMAKSANKHYCMKICCADNWDYFFNSTKVCVARCLAPYIPSPRLQLLNPSERLTLLTGFLACVHPSHCWATFACPEDQAAHQIKLFLIHNTRIPIMNDHRGHNIDLCGINGILSMVVKVSNTLMYLVFY